MLGELCEPWPVTWCCDLDTDTVDDLPDKALMAASETLWYATGRQYGNCNALFRPCRRSCPSLPTGLRWYEGALGGSGWPYPALVGGAWVNLACGICSYDCSCSHTSEVRLPEIVDLIVEIEIDGETLPSSGWAGYDGTTLVRTDGGQWPTCQDWTVTGGPGTWIVTARFGEEVPALGQLAVGVLACELMKACRGEDCDLPDNVVAIDRQGVSYQFANPTEILREGRTGLAIPDQFINSVNPNRLLDRSRVWSPDLVRGRRPW